MTPQIAHPIPSHTGITQEWGADPSTYRVAQLAGHAGVDFAAPIGTPVCAAAAGTVIHAGPGDTGRCAWLLGNAAGLAVVIEHPLFLDLAHVSAAMAEHPGMPTGEFTGSTLTVYAHLDELAVHVGAETEPGDLIGTVGETGWTGTPHLHFETIPLGPRREVDTGNGMLGRVNPHRLLDLARTDYDRPADE